MKHKWPWLTLFVALLLLVAAAGCGGDDDEGAAGDTGAPTETAAGPSISVGMVSDTGGLDDRGFNTGQPRSDCRIGFEADQHAMLQHGPHPFHLLLAPARVQLSAFDHRIAMGKNSLPELRDSTAVQR